MMNDNGITTNCILGCGCTRILAGNRRMGESVYCALHKRSVPVTSNLPEYRSVCQKPKCRYGTRYHGQAPLTAVVKGSTHSVKYRHTVYVYHGDVLHETIGVHHQPTLPGLTTEQ